ncbi:hypothetical protein [Chryseobacterium joostei]|uniref:hypothetical protein n=1 Tax=Chryseobacterium joostei TaxID=112234 RepID=UPI0023F1FEA4|nr:hypothetical protein [Chryseobacterium joostei]
MGYYCSPHYLFPLNSCRTDEILTDTEQTQKEKIAFFERFEKEKSLSKNAGSSNYAIPFGNSMLAYFSNYPEKKTELENKYGTVDLRVSSQDMDLENGRKLLMFPMLTDGKVTAVIGGVINAERDFLYFDVYKEGHPDRDYLIQTFQQHYNSLSLGRTIDVGEVVIIVKKPALTKPDPWDEDPGDGGHDMGGGPGDYGGGGGGASSGNSGTSDPCGKAETHNDDAKEIVEDSAVSVQKAAITMTIKTDTNEKSFSFGKDKDGKYQTTAVKTGTGGNSVGVVATSGSITIQGGAHTHTAGLYSSFSAGDFYAFQQANASNSSFIYYYVFGADNSTYVFNITNPTNFANFASNYPVATYFDTTTGGWNIDSSIGLDFNISMQQFINGGKTDDEAFALASALIMNKYKMGLSLSKRDNMTGKFKSLFVKENHTFINAGGTPIVLLSYSETTDCNL